MASAKTKLKIFGGVAVCIVASAYFLVPVVDDYLDPGMCSDEILGEFASPGGAYVATAFERACGATVSGTTVMVIMRESNRSLRISRNGAIKFPNHFDPQQEPDIVLIVDGPYGPDLRWRGSNVLELSASLGNEFKTLQSWRDVKIKYK